MQRSYDLCRPEAAACSSTARPSAPTSWWPVRRRKARHGSGWKAFVARTPLSDARARDILRIETGDGRLSCRASPPTQKKDRLSRCPIAIICSTCQGRSRRDRLLSAIAPTGGACGIDAVSALDCWGFGLPGFQGLKLAPGGAAHGLHAAPAMPQTGGSDTFHFPDGNASIARLLVRSLIPGVDAGPDAEDIVTAKADYASSIGPGAPCASGSPASSCGRAMSRERRRDRLSLCAAAARCHAVRAKALRARLLEHDDPLSVPGAARAAEGGAALAGQDAAGLYQCRAAQLDGVPEAGICRRLRAGRLSLRRSRSTSRSISAAIRAARVAR